MSERRWLQRSAAAVLMSGQLVGCTSWHPETLSPAVVIADKQPNAMRVEYGESHHEVLYQPRVLGDSLVGWREWSDKPSERAVALADVKRIATRRFSAGRTTALLLVTGAVVGVFVGLKNMAGGLGNWGQ